jgi:hypothetical protein
MTEQDKLNVLLLRVDAKVASIRAAMGRMTEIKEKDRGVLTGEAEQAAGDLVILADAILKRAKNITDEVRGWKGSAHR